MSTTTETYAPFIESDARAGAAELRAVMEEHGYLFFRGLVPADEVLRVRRDVLELCAEAGWLNPSRDVMDGIAAPGHKPLKEGMPEYTPVYRKVLKTPSFHDFPLNLSLRRVAQKVLGLAAPDDVLVHPRRIGRVTFPNLLSATTPPHQDHHYIRGAVETYSCWTPLGECPIELGGLAVLPKSQTRGFLEHSVKSTGVGGAGVPLEGEALQWHLSDFGVGDVLFFHSFTIHKAMPNLTENRLRVSTDNRYQRPKDAIDPGSLKPHMNLELD
jgi:ectoine hydroxylase-related dioxygenase (phytanoyl-CoA dioxygenase family)